jgi:acetyl esterase/lipase
MQSGRTWLRAVLTVAAAVVLAPVAPVVLSAFLPYSPVLANISRLVVPWLPWLVLMAALATVLALLAVRVDGYALQHLVAAVALVTLAGTVLMAGRVVAFARSMDASISWSRTAGSESTPMPGTPDEQVFATVDGTPLHAQIWRNSTSAFPDQVHPVAIALFVHGGSFTGGALGGRPWLFFSLAESDVAVVDIEYRLAPPARWDQAPGDVLCALGWVEDQPSFLEGAQVPVVVIGDSAGGNLALMAAYAAGTAKVASSCDKPTTPPAAVIAIEPAADLAAIWSDASVPGDGAPFPESYIGGSPMAYPDRYAAASPERLFRPGLPPTLLLAAENDHLILPVRTSELARRLAAVHAACTLVTVPYAEHGIAAGPDDYGEQLQEQLIPAYIRRVIDQSPTSVTSPFGAACA